MILRRNYLVNSKISFVYKPAKIIIHMGIGLFSVPNYLTSLTSKCIVSSSIFTSSIEQPVRNALRITLR